MDGSDLNVWYVTVLCQHLLHRNDHMPMELRKHPPQWDESPQSVHVRAFEKYGIFHRVLTHTLTFGCR